MNVCACELEKKKRKSETEEQNQQKRMRGPVMLVRVGFYSVLSGSRGLAQFSRAVENSNNGKVRETSVKTQ